MDTPGTRAALRIAFALDLRPLVGVLGDVHRAQERGSVLLERTECVPPWAIASAFRRPWADALDAAARPQLLEPLAHAGVGERVSVAPVVREVLIGAVQNLADDVRGPLLGLVADDVS